MPDVLVRDLSPRALARLKARATGGASLSGRWRSPSHEPMTFGTEPHPTRLPRSHVNAIIRTMPAITEEVYSSMGLTSDEYQHWRNEWLKADASIRDRIREADIVFYGRQPIAA